MYIKATAKYARTFIQYYYYCWCLSYLLWSGPVELVLSRAILARLISIRSMNGRFACYHRKFHHNDASLACSCGLKRERAFSGARSTITRDCNTLSSDTIEALHLQASWLHRSVVESDLLKLQAYIQNLPDAVTS